MRRARRDGRILEWRRFGYRSRAEGKTLGTNDIFAIASLGKIVTTVTSLALMEEGKLTLREPISRLLPALEEMNVRVGGTVDSLS